MDVRPARGEVTYMYIMQRLWDSTQFMNKVITLLISLHSRCFQESMPREQNCEQV